MNKLVFLFLLFIGYTSFGQPNDYYETCVGLVGDELREELNNIIKNHTVFSYTTTKAILRDSDEDPNNSSNILLVYSGNSIDKFDFASNQEQDFWNREHVWPKSHGDFAEGDPYEVPLFTDAHNLKPADSSMNNTRGEKDFDNGGEVVMNGSVVTECLTTSNEGLNGTFEPRDDVKGDIARIILYMDVRYEGNEGGLDLTPADGLTTYPNPEIGVLSTLIEWHQTDPPDAFERRRNDMIYKWQRNRNPFIDYPQFVDYVFSENPQINPIDITNVTLNPDTIEGDQNFSISTNVLSAINCPIQSVTLNYGNNWWDISNSIEMSINEDGEYQCQIPGQPYNTMFCYSITATICESAFQTFYGSEVIPPYPFEGIITPISEIQGGIEFSPYEGQSVNTTGIVTGAFANSFYIQDGSEPWSGIYIYSGDALPSLGDSVIVTGEISEFCWNGSLCSCSECGGAGVTEIYQPEDIYIISNNNPLPEPILVNSGDVLQEQYEGVLIRMENVECTNLADGYGVWQVNDGTGLCGIHNTPDGYEHDEEIGEVYNITGIVTSTFNEWKVDLRMASDVESGTDVLAPYILTHSCYQVDDYYYVYLYFNEAIDPSFLDISNFLIANASIESIASDMFDPTKITLTLSDVIDQSMGLIIFEMGDLNQNLGTNLTYAINCDNFWVEDIDELKSIINVFPNPSSGDIYISLKSKSEISLFDMLGNMIFNKVLDGGDSKINIQNTGVFYLEINDTWRMPIIITN